MASCSPAASGFHALVIPYPTQGHITPMMQFAKKLASTGLTVTFVTTHHAYAQITKAHSEDSRVQLEAPDLILDIRSAQISDGLPLDFDRSAKFFDFMRSVDNMGEELEQVIHKLNNTGPPVSCVIADTALFWSLDVTKKFGIPWISFWTQPTTIYSIYYHAHLLESHPHSLYKGSGDEGNILIDYIPGVPTFHPRDLPSFLHEQDPVSQYLLDLLLKSLESCRRADWVLCNSFDDLESSTVEMKLEPPVFHVGPLLPSGYLKDMERPEEDMKVGTSIWTEYDASAWLDTKPNGSVIYISFGSLLHVSKAQLEEIAMGLKGSGHPFLWVLRLDIVASTASDCLPDGFLDEMGSQCLIVPWCTQLRVLSHPSLGGFITHCGWNSMLESIALGVPMIGFPGWAEQYTNCMLMADEWEIGIRLTRGGADDKMIVREDICRAIIKLFGHEGKQMRKNVEALRDSARTAVKDGGSSHKNIETFVEDMKARI